MTGIALIFFESEFLSACHNPFINSSCVPKPAARSICSREITESAPIGVFTDDRSNTAALYARRGLIGMAIK